MNAVFYDRVNKREVNSSELMQTRCVRSIVACDTDERTVVDLKRDSLYTIDDLIGELAYRSDRCPSYQNWDLYTNTNDLVFLRLESED